MKNTGALKSSKSSAPGSAEPQLRNDCLSFGASKRSWGSAVPGEKDQFSSRFSLKTSGNGT